MMPLVYGSLIRVTGFWLFYLFVIPYREEEPTYATTDQYRKREAFRCNQNENFLKFKTEAFPSSVKLLNQNDIIF